MNRFFVRYSPKLKALARQLRNNSTLAEVLLWNELKRGHMKGYDFHRQKPIDNYIVDFFCPKLMLAVEIDGDSHLGRVAEDSIRQQSLEQLGIRFLRFDDFEVKANMRGVLKTITEWIENYEADIRKKDENIPLSRGESKVDDSSTTRWVDSPRPFGSVDP
jgi:very-short-patch-repair endonuclease